MYKETGHREDKELTHGHATIADAHRRNPRSKYKMSAVVISGPGTQIASEFFCVLFYIFQNRCISYLLLGKKSKILKRTQAEVSEETWSKGEPEKEKGTCDLLKTALRSVFQDLGSHWASEEIKGPTCGCSEHQNEKSRMAMALSNLIFLMS